MACPARATARGLRRGYRPVASTATGFGAAIFEQGDLRLSSGENFKMRNFGRVLSNFAPQGIHPGYSAPSPIVPAGKLYTTSTVLSSVEALKKTEFCIDFVQFCAGFCAPFCSRWFALLSSLRSQRALRFSHLFSLFAFLRALCDLCGFFLFVFASLAVSFCQSLASSLKPQAPSPRLTSAQSTR